MEVTEAEEKQERRRKFGKIAVMEASGKLETVKATAKIEKSDSYSCCGLRPTAKKFVFQYYIYVVIHL